MNPPKMSGARALLFAASLCVAAACATARAQGQTAQAQSADEDVVRIEAELVQTDVLVLDERGRFVKGLRPEQFELKVDGRPVPIAFFEEVVAGSAAEEAHLAALASGRAPAPKGAEAAGARGPRGRTVIFFVDDLHLSLSSFGRTREALSHFIEKEMGPHDQVAITSASGRIGFLQQLTDDKVVLRAALARLSYVPYTVTDIEWPPMSEYLALRIDRGDRDAVGFFVTRCLKDNPGYNAAKCARAVADRARRVIQQASVVTDNTLLSLQSLMDTAAALPGRKLVLLVSDGFFLGTNHRYSNVNDRLPKIVDDARRRNVVIYTMDGRGLISNQANSLTSVIDFDGILDRANLGEIPASQHALNALAEDTGGRALRNSNSITGWVTDTLKETSRYYLLAWRPELPGGRANKFRRVSVGVLGHPEWSVRLPKGYLDRINDAAAKAGSGRKSPAEQGAKDERGGEKGAALKSALVASTPRRALPSRLSLSFLDTPENGLVLTASAQVETDALNYGEDGRQPAEVDLAGVILNADGKPSTSFQTRLNVSPPAAGGSERAGGVIYNYRARLAPGLYQVRVAARDARSGRVGSDMEWVEIPDVKSQRLTMSSLLIGVQEVESGRVPAGAAAPQVQFSVDGRFARSSRLGFWVFIYNARRADVAGAQGLTARVQVFDAEGRAVVNTPARPVATEGAADPARIPYLGSFPLHALAPGLYLLQVTLSDAATSIVRQARFTVE